MTKLRHNASGASYTMPEGNVTFKAVWVQDQWDGQAVVEPAKDENGYYQISTGQSLRISEIRTVQTGKRN